MSAVVGTTLPRNARNNNPLNLEYSPTWQGLKPEPRTDPRFCEFVTMARGFRAAAVTLCTYQDRYGIVTIRDAIARWAPPGENDTNAYMTDVCAQSHFSPDEKVDFHNFTDAGPIILAMAKHEGDYPFKRPDLIAGCAQAGLTNVPRGVVGSAVKTVAPVVGGVAGYAAENTDFLIDKFNWLHPLVAAGPVALRYGFWGLVIAIGLAVGFGELKKIQRKQ